MRTDILQDLNVQEHSCENFCNAFSWLFLH